MSTIQTIALILCGSGGIAATIISLIKFPLDTKLNNSKLNLSNSDFIEKQFMIYQKLSEANITKQENEISELKIQIKELLDRTVALETAFRLEVQEKDKLKEELYKLKAERDKLKEENAQLNKQIYDLEEQIKILTRE